jgi:hypothetical protein
VRIAGQRPTKLVCAWVSCSSPFRRRKAVPSGRHDVLLSLVLFRWRLDGIMELAGLRETDTNKAPAKSEVKL